MMPRKRSDSASSGSRSTALFSISTDFSLSPGSCEDAYIFPSRVKEGANSGSVSIDSSSFARASCILPVDIYMRARLYFR